MRTRHRRSGFYNSRSARVFGITLMAFFAALGVLLLLGAWVVFEARDLKHLPVLLSFGAMFATAGLAGIWGTLRDQGVHKRDLARKQKHPDAPWLWFDEWKDGRVAGHGRQRMILVWCVALFWSALVGAMFLAGLDEFHAGGPVMVGMIPFLATVVGFYAWAVRLTLRWWRFGSSTLVLETFPGVIGGKLRATLVQPSSAHPFRDLRARLSCHRVDAEERSASESTLWLTEVTLPANRALVLAEGTGRAMEFAIPAGLEPSSPLPAMEEIVWDVDVWEEGRGIGYSASFQVPVFVTAESLDPSEPEPEVAHDPIHTPAGARFDTNSRIHVSPSPTGGYDFLFPPPRLAGHIAAIAGALVVATATCVAFLSGEVPLRVSLLFGVLDLFCIGLALAFFARGRLVHVGTQGVRVHRGRFGLLWERVIPRDAIAAIEPWVILEADALMLHDLRLVRTDGTDVAVGIFIASRQEAAWLAGRMREALEGG